MQLKELKKRLKKSQGEFLEMELDFADMEDIEEKFYSIEALKSKIKRIVNLTKRVKN